MPLKIETTPLPGSRLEIRVEADADEVEKSYDRLFSHLQAEARIPGFRPGKAPRALLERRFDAKALRGMAWQEFMEKSLAPEMEKLNIQPYGDAPEMPNLDEWDGFQRGAPLEFSLTWTIHPRPELPDYLHLKLVKPSAEVMEEDLDEQLQSLREAHAKQEPVDRTTVEDGDVVTAHVVIYKPGTEDEVLDETDAELGASVDAENALRNSLVGKTKGEEFETTVHLGDGTPQPEMAGQEAKAKVRVDAIAERVLPELDADFAKTVDESLDSVEGLREYVRERLSKQRAEAAERMVRSLAMGLVNAGTRMGLPTEMVNKAATGQMRRYAHDMISDGMTMEKVQEIVSDRETGVADAILNETISDLRTMYIEDALAREQDLEVEETDIDRALAEYAQEHGIEVPALRQMVEMQEETEEQFADRARRMKIMDMLVENAEIEEVPWEAFPLRSRRLVEEAAEAVHPSGPRSSAEPEELPLPSEALEEEAAEVEEEEEPTTVEPEADPAAEEEES
jgi:trigger factor